jgi:hypothetical protein
VTKISVDSTPHTLCHNRAVLSTDKSGVESNTALVRSTVRGRLGVAVVDLKRCYM